jgi:hypothetical protein
MDLHKKNKHNKSDKNGVAKRDLKIMQLEEEMKKKKAFLLKKRKELYKNKELNEYLEIVNKDYNKFYEDEMEKKQNEYKAMNYLKDYITYLVDQNHLVKDQLITAKHDKKELLHEINKIKSEIDKLET